MTTVWGLLEKSQTDAQKIEEAIDAAIEAHEADEAAHLGVGESLQSHKASEIIDHAANSVVRDKLEFDRFTIDSDFQSIDCWGVSGDVQLMGAGDMAIQSAHTTNSVAYAYLAVGEGVTNQAHKAYTPIFKTRVKFLASTTQLGYILSGMFSESKGWGFKISNSTLYATWFDTGGTAHNVEIEGVDITTWHNYEVRVLSDTSAEWYVDGALATTQTGITLRDSDFFMQYYIKTTDNVGRDMHVQNLHYDCDYLA